MTAESIIATVAFVLVLVALTMQIVALFRRLAKPGSIGSWALLVASVLLVAVLVMRSVRIGFPALTSTWESLTFWAAIIGLVSWGYGRRTTMPYRPALVFGATMAQAVVLSLANSPLIPSEALPPIPALRSGWLVLHVSFAFIGEAFFIAGFVAAVLYLASRDATRRLELDRLTYTAVAVGYPFFTAGALVFGAIWAQHAWGRWWSWDPKETWALVTWLVYTIYLHARLVRGWKGKLPAIMAVAGFLCTLFTFFGVNYLLAGLHSYG